MEITFDPSAKLDHVTGTLEKQVTILYREHPQRDTINLIGDLSFPNIQFDTPRVSTSFIPSCTEMCLCLFFCCGCAATASVHAALTQRLLYTRLCSTRVHLSRLCRRMKTE